MKLLVLYQGRVAERDQPGYHEGFCRLVSEGILEAHAAIPFVGVAEEQGWAGVWQEAYNVVQAGGVDAVFLQFFHARMPDPTPAIERLLALPSKPTVFTSLGDPYGRWTNRVPGEFRAASRLSEVTFLTGMGYLAEQLVGGGTKNAVLMPHGCCQVRFTGALQRDLYKPEFDVAFIGSRMTAPNPFGHFVRAGRRRDQFVRAMTKRYGRRFGLFGGGWDGNPSWQGRVPYVEQQDAMRRAKVVMGGLPNAYYDYYTSDREFIALASGVPFVDYRERGLSQLFRDGSEWWLSGDIDGMMARADGLLALPERERVEKAAETRERVLREHTQYHRCREMIRIVKEVRRARLTGQRARAPKLSFLLDASPLLEPAPPAILGWEG